MSRAIKIHAYGFPSDRWWPEGICAVPLDAFGPGVEERPSGPILVSAENARYFVQEVFKKKPGKLRVALLLPIRSMGSAREILGLLRHIRLGRQHGSPSKICADKLESGGARNPGRRGEHKGLSLKAKQTA